MGFWTVMWHPSKYPMEMSISKEDYLLLSFNTIINPYPDLNIHLEKYVFDFYENSYQS